MARLSPSWPLAQLQWEDVTAGHLHQWPPGAKPPYKPELLFHRMLARGGFSSLSPFQQGRCWQTW